MSVWIDSEILLRKLEIPVNVRRNTPTYTKNSFLSISFSKSFWNDDMFIRVRSFLAYGKLDYLSIPIFCYFSHYMIFWVEIYFLYDSGGKVCRLRVDTKE